MRQISATSVGFQVDRGTEAALTTTVPAAATNLLFFHQIVPTTAAARNHNIDFISARGTYLSARW